VTYNTLVNMFATRGEVIQAMEVVRQMRRDGRVAPSYITYTSLLDACAESHRPDLAHAVVKEMKATGVTPDIACLNALLKACAVVGHTREATAVYGEIGKAKKDPVKKNIVTYNTMLWMLMQPSRFQKIKEVFGVLEEMDEVGMAPDAVTLSILFKGFNDLKKSWHSLTVYRKYREEVIASASMAVFGPLLRALLFSRTREREVVEQVLRDMRVSGVLPTDAVHHQLNDIFVDEIGNFRDGLRILDRVRNSDRRRRNNSSRHRTNRSRAVPVSSAADSNENDSLAAQVLGLKPAAAFIATSSQPSSR